MALGVLRQDSGPVEFGGENAYRQWFVAEALELLFEELTGEVLDSFQVERRLPSGVRIDVLAKGRGGAVRGFELKARNRKNPQTAEHALLQGVGQALLYQDILMARFGSAAAMYLVSDAVSERVAGVLLRHGIFVGLVEANTDHILCISRACNVPHS